MLAGKRCKGFFHQGENMRSRSAYRAAIELCSRYARLPRAVDSGKQHVGFDADPHAIAGLCSQLYIGIAIAGAICAGSLVPTYAFAAEPVGHITIARDVPVHDAFRAGDVGQRTDVPTAREDIVIANTRTIADIPQSLPDSTLGNVAGHAPVRIDTAQQIGSIVATSTIGISDSAIGPRAALPGMSSASAIGGTIADGIASIIAPVSGLAGRK